jgi:hypothetical protein
MVACAVGGSIAFGAAEEVVPATSQRAKNWTAPAAKIYAQKLADEIMGQHPELLSVTFHGVPPDLDKVYTMFAGSYPDRIGNPDDPDDIDVITKGITIIDPRWRRNDPQKKFVVQTPLRDATGENIGLIVYAFKADGGSAKSEADYVLAAISMRNGLDSQIPSYDALFAPAR